jgi:hypothetical protein
MVLPNAFHGMKFQIKLVSWSHLTDQDIIVHRSYIFPLVYVTLASDWQPLNVSSVYCNMKVKYEILLTVFLNLRLQYTTDTIFFPSSVSY